MINKQRPTKREFEAMYKILPMGKRFVISFVGWWHDDLIQVMTNEGAKVIQFNKHANATKFLKKFIDDRKSYYQ
jgi:hypothetical protein